MGVHDAARTAGGPSRRKFGSTSLALAGSAQVPFLFDTDQADQLLQLLLDLLRTP